ncbi:sigma 54-interacting transcriptional regulator [Desulfovibrio subterraneus]|uniref:sigma-54 interaction domain-containing protein n=1 Tax=Desulfovibrio subterraneus TaxID=2718620 RepID=UPI0022B929B8|nr:sigma 54-interacting transcriptional regulator [Desulfovibrio subterraneus]WBF68517.1 sigma 54-interacting transcriptional regulator [Desulfovibrio subterraneus]
MFDHLDLFTDIKHLIEFQRKIIEYSADGLMVVDKDGRIVYINDSFKELHNVNEQEVINNHVTAIIDNTRMHIVAQTGIAEHDHFQDISGTPYVVSRIPIIENDECVGAIGLIRFRYMEEVQALTDKITKLREQLKNMHAVRSASADTEHTFDDIMGVAPAVKQAKEAAMQAARTEATVLLRGESGVGKEFFAQSIHVHSHRSNGPFIRLNCSAIQETLIEAELFGYEDGAFTGARKGGRKGKFELADGGTIFLDEIGDMPLSAQAKLLRVLQEKEVDRLGSEKMFKVDVRVVAATNRDLERMVAAGEFREDLFYRLNVIPVFIPPLREVPEELPRLAKNIWRKLSKKHGIFHKRLTEKAFIALQHHVWRGNIRELQNVLERTIVMVRHDRIDETDIHKILIQSTAQPLWAEPSSGEGQFDLTELVEQTEKRALCYALSVAQGNRSKAAKLLGISRPLLYKKMGKYGLEENRQACQTGIC